MFEKLKAKNFEILALHHAEAILKHDMNGAFKELEGVLLAAQLPARELISGGGGETKFTQRLRKSLSDEFGWRKHVFEIRKTVDGKEKEFITHEIDHIKVFRNYTFALEIEWNNKDPFFDRDLENFKRLHADGVISLGAIVTRGKSLHEGMKPIIENFARAEGIRGFPELKPYYTPTARQRRMIEAAAASKGSFESGWAHVFVSDKYGEATTHWKKLADRVHRGVGNPCPLLLIGIPRDIVTM